MTTTLKNTISQMKEVTAKEFNDYFKNNRFASKSYYYTDENNRIYVASKKDVAVYLYEESKYYLSR